MSKVIIKGVKEDGTFDTETKSTAVLITELIEKVPKLCEAEIQHELEDIRKSAERDTRIRQTFAHLLKEKNIPHKKEKKLVNAGIKAAKKCAEEHHDVESMLAILRLCKAIAGDKFQVVVESEYCEEKKDGGD